MTQTYSQTPRAPQVLLSRTKASNDPDTATAETIAEMCAQIHRAARDPRVQRAALAAAAVYRGGPLYTGDPRSRAALAQSCWWWAKHAITFEHHEQMIRKLLNEASQLQLLISPDVLVRMESKRGDCAVFTQLVCCFLEVLRVPWEIVTVACNPMEPGVYSHVYPRAVLEDGSRIALDASHGKYPGWRVPSKHTYRAQVWDRGARPIPDLAPTFAGLHQYRGLGDDADGDVTGGNTTTLNYPWASVDAGSQPPFVASGTTAPSSPGFNVGGFLANLANQWTQIGGRVIAPQTTIQRGPNGQLLIQTPGNNPATSALIGTAAGAGAALPSYVIWGGLGIVALLVVSQMGKR